MAQTSFTPGPGADFVGDDDGDGLTDVAADQAISRGRRPASIGAGSFSSGGRDRLRERGRHRRRRLRGRGFVASTAVEGFPERERVYFGAPTGCGDQRLPRVLASVHPRLRFHAGEHARDRRRGGRHRRRRRRRPGRRYARERRRSTSTSRAARASCRWRLFPHR